MIDLVGVEEFARIAGISRQSVHESKERAKKPTYRGSFPAPDVTIGSRDYWYRDTAERYAVIRKK